MQKATLFPPVFETPKASPLRQIAATIALCSLFVPAAQAAAVAGPWSVGTGSGLITSGGSSASPIVGSGVAESADNTAIHAPLGTAIILSSVGQGIQLTGLVELIGSDGLGDQFRFGLFGSNAQTGVSGWTGYVASAVGSGQSGQVRERATGNYWSAGGAGSTGFTGDFLATPGASLAAGTYQFSLTLTRTASGLDFATSMINTSTLASHAPFSGSDSSVTSYSFDRVGFLMGDSMNADQVRFSSVGVSAVPEPSSAALGLLGIISLASSRRRARK
jgi:hypothetical protein